MTISAGATFQAYPQRIPKANPLNNEQTLKTLRSRTKNQSKTLRIPAPNNRGNSKNNTHLSTTKQTSEGPPGPGCGLGCLSFPNRGRPARYTADRRTAKRNHLAGCVAVLSARRKCLCVAKSISEKMHPMATKGARWRQRVSLRIPPSKYRNTGRNVSALVAEQLG